MNHGPHTFLSVIIPTFNAATTIKAALHSVVTQAEPGVEVLVVDGGSTDGTTELARSVEGVRVLSAPDKGPYDAMNKGIGLTTAPWIYFLGGDDVLMHCLHDIRRRLVRQDRTYYGDVILVAKRKRLKGPMTWKRLQVSNICQQAIFYPRKAFAQGGFELRFPVLADWAFNLSSWHLFPFRHIPVVVALYSGQGLSMRTQDESFQRARAELVASAIKNATAGQRIARWLFESAQRLRLRLVGVLGGA
jgi:glycosyltransferase involved in cell wall biosynthesis